MVAEENRGLDELAERTYSIHRNSTIADSTDLDKGWLNTIWLARWLIEYHVASTNGCLNIKAGMMAG